jgi:hypothetical protein
MELQLLAKMAPWCWWRIQILFLPSPKLVLTFMFKLDLSIWWPSQPFRQRGSQRHTISTVVIFWKSSQALQTMLSLHRFSITWRWIKLNLQSIRLWGTIKKRNKMSDFKLRRF